VPSESAPRELSNEWSCQYFLTILDLFGQFLCLALGDRSHHQLSCLRVNGKEEHVHWVLLLAAEQVLFFNIINRCHDTLCRLNKKDNQSPYCPTCKTKFTSSTVEVITFFSANQHTFSLICLFQCFLAELRLEISDVSHSQSVHQLSWVNVLKTFQHEIVLNFLWDLSFYFSWIVLCVLDLNALSKFLSFCWIILMKRKDP
jgi:hypothetical protein